MAARGVLTLLFWSVRDRFAARPKPRRGRRRQRQGLGLSFIPAAILALIVGAALGIWLSQSQHARLLADRTPRPRPAIEASRSGIARPRPPSPGSAGAPVHKTAPVEPPSQPAPGRPAVPAPAIAQTEPPPAAPPLAALAPPPAPHGDESQHYVYEEPAPPTPAERIAPRPLGKPALPRDRDRLAFAPPQGPEPLWLRNARAMPPVGDRPMIAIVIDDVGLDRRHSDEAVTDLPPAVTLSYMAYAPDVAAQAAAARDHGHEIMVHVPMEPDSRTIDAGSHVLRVGDSRDAILRNLDWDLDRFTGYVAINNHMGSRFTRDVDGMRAVLATLKARGLFFLDSRTTPATVGPQLAAEMGLPYLERDVFLDNVESAAEIAARLAEVERIARHDGYAVAIGHPHAVTLTALIQWVPEVRRQGFVLVPISAVMRVRLAAEHLKAQYQRASTAP